MEKPPTDRDLLVLHTIWLIAARSDDEQVMASMNSICDALGQIFGKYPVDWMELASICDQREYALYKGERAPMSQSNIARLRTMIESVGGKLAEDTDEPEPLHHWTIRDSDYIDRPTDHRDLREFLGLVERASKEHREADLKALEMIARGRFGDEEIEMREYIMGLIERLPGKDTNPEYYFTSDHDLAIDKEQLHRVAYGDFLEAAAALRTDLRTASDEYRSYQEPDLHRVFDSRFFTPEQQKIWHAFTRIPAKILDTDASEGELYLEAREDLARYEDYLEQVYGVRCPVLVATYVDWHGTGYSVVVSLDAGTVEVQTKAPFGDEIRTHINTQLPLGNDDFNPTIFAKKYGDFTLGDVSRDRLYPYELFSRAD